MEKADPWKRCSAEGPLLMFRNLLCAVSLVLTLAASILTWNVPATATARIVAGLALAGWLFLLVYQETRKGNPHE